MAKEIKILMTGTYGAGWSTWCRDPEVADFILTYQPIINYIDGQTSDEYGGRCHHDLDEDHPLIKSLEAEIIEKFGKDRVPYFGGAKNLVVRTIYPKSLCELLGIQDRDGGEYLPQ